MAMKWLDRVKRALGAATADLLENEDDIAPARVRSGTRLSDALAALRDRLAWCTVELHTITRARETTQGELDALLAKAQFAVGEAREDLARAALQHRLTLEQKRDDSHANEGLLRAEIEQLEAVIAAIVASEAGGESAPATDSRIMAQLAELDRLTATRERIGGTSGG